MHRRSFFKKSALLGTGLLVADNLFAGLSLKPVNVAMIGCGDRGKGVLSVLKQKIKSNFKQEIIPEAILDSIQPINENINVQN